MLLPWIVLVFVLIVAVWGLVHSMRLKGHDLHEERLSHRHDVTGRRPRTYE